MYPDWLASWDQENPSGQGYYRMGLGRDRVLNEAELVEQMRRVSRHENDPRLGFYGPPLVHVCDGQQSRQRASICYLMESAVEARVLLSRLKDMLQRRGVVFWSADVTKTHAVEAVLHEIVNRNMPTRGRSPRPWVLAAGAWSLDIIKAWAGSLPQSFDAASVRYSWGATAVFGSQDFKPSSTVLDLDWQRYVIEGLIDRSQRQIVSLTSHDGAVLLSSLNASKGQPRIVEQELQDDWLRVQGLIHRHGFSVAQPLQQLLGLRAKFTSQDLLCSEIPCPETLGRVVKRCQPAGQQGLPRVWIFAGANRSGFAYGPALAASIVHNLVG
jgi:hypothetical protein